MILTRYFSRARRLGRAERGATAIEYAIIAGIVSLGIVGSLVATKTSLNSIFGVASSNMGSATGSGSGSSGATPSQAAVTAAYWSGKTLVSTTNVTGGKKFTYSDGTTAQYTSGNAAPFSNQLVIGDPNASQNQYTWTDSSGKPNLFEVEYRNFPGGLSGPRSGYDCSAVCSNTTPSTFAGDPPLPTGQVQATYNQSGQQLSYTTITPTAAFLNQAATGYQNYLYFKALAGQ